MRLYFFTFLVFALTSSVAAPEPSQAEASSPTEASSSQVEQPASQWKNLYHNTNGSLASNPKTSTTWDIYLRLQTKNVAWNQTTDDVMQIFSNGSVLERASTYTLNRPHNKLKSTLVYQQGYNLVNKDVSLLVKSTISLAGFWGRCHHGIKRKVSLLS
jgi:hypothetical protein